MEIELRAQVLDAKLLEKKLKQLDGVMIDEVEAESIIWDIFGKVNGD